MKSLLYVPLPHQEYSIIYLPQLHKTNIHIVSNNDYIYLVIIVHVHVTVLCIIKLVRSSLTIIYIVTQFKLYKQVLLSWKQIPNKK